MKKDLLIITRSNDSHVEQLLPKLHKQKGINITIIKTDECINKHLCSLKLFDNELGASFVFEGKVIDPTSVWYRKPAPLTFKNGMALDVAAFAERESEIFWRNAFSLFPSSSLWVNNPVALQKSELKSLQLIYAKECGFEVAPTIITNDPAEGEIFCIQNEWDIIAKTIGSPVVKIDNVVKNTYARKLGLEKIDQLKHLKVCPTILQKFIPTKREVRVVVISGEIFPMEIYHNETGIVDSRAIHSDKVRYRDFSLPKDVQELCINMVRGFDLVFSSMDLIESIDGEWYFLDLNPNGQWLWLEKFSKKGIADAFVSHLINGSM